VNYASHGEVLEEGELRQPRGSTGRRGTTPATGKYWKKGNYASHGEVLEELKGNYASHGEVLEEGEPRPKGKAARQPQGRYWKKGVTITRRREGTCSSRSTVKSSQKNQHTVNAAANARNSKEVTIQGDEKRPPVTTALSL
jgi:hypothetical protein